MVDLHAKLKTTENEIEFMDLDCITNANKDRFSGAQWMTNNNQHLISEIN